MRICCPDRSKVPVTTASTSASAAMRFRSTLSPANREADALERTTSDASPLSAFTTASGTLKARNPVSGSSRSSRNGRTSNRVNGATSRGGSESASGLSWPSSMTRSLVDRRMRRDGCVDAHDGRREAVSDPRDGHDQGLAIVGKRLSKKRDVPGQTGFFDEAVRPDRLKEIGLPDDLAGPLDEHQERLEDLRREGDPNAVPHEQRAVGRQDEPAERVAATQFRSAVLHGVGRKRSLL